MFIQAEKTPNPLSMKFITNSEIAPQNTNVVYQKNGNLENIPNFVKDIFLIEKVTTVMINSQFITISIKEEVNLGSFNEDDAWATIKPEIIHILLDHGQNNGLKVENEPQPNHGIEKKEFTGIEKEINDLIEERVRPAVEMDGGDIEFVRFEESTGTVFVKMKGSCDGCPSSSATLKGGIQRMLEYYVPEVVDVVPITE